MERFRVANGLVSAKWARKSALYRKTFNNALKGRDVYVDTIRAIVRAASDLLQRPVRANEVFDVGEDTPPEMTIPRRVIAESKRRSLKRFPSRLDRILRGEGIAPSDFAYHAGLTRQGLLRFRVGAEEPSLSTLASIVRALRQMTGKAYRATHLYDVGELPMAA